MATMIKKYNPSYFPYLNFIAIPGF